MNSTTGLSAIVSLMKVCTACWVSMASSGPGPVGSNWVTSVKATS
jgi:hypothetical protein